MLPSAEIFVGFLETGARQRVVECCSGETALT
jgi:hypothetical protein